ncbi:hypothetical protein D3C84_955670 [compost metagenome]
MRLVEHQVTAGRFGARLEEVVEAHFEQIRRAGITGDMPAQFAIGVIGPGNHHQGIPAHDRRQTLFNGQVPWKHRLLFNADGIDVGRAVTGPPADVRSACHGHQHVQDLPGLCRAAVGDDGQQCIAPLGDFLSVFRGLAR